MDSEYGKEHGHSETYNFKKVGHGYGGKAHCIYVFRLRIPFALKSECIQ